MESYVFYLVTYDLQSLFLKVIKKKKNLAKKTNYVSCEGDIQTYVFNRTDSLQKWTICGTS